MAITRCPYCRAIIDEKDKFCTNCGTQLLYAEDAGVEEDIPGEKITHADIEEKDYTIPEPEGEESGDVIIRDEEPEEDTVHEAEEETGEEELTAGEVGEGEAEEAEKAAVLADEPGRATAESKEFRELGSVLVAEEEKEGPGEEAAEKPEPAEEKPKPAKKGTRAERPAGPRQKTLGFPRAEEPVAPAAAPEEREVKEPETLARPPAESETAAPPSTRKDMTFDTEELNRIGPTVDLAHRQVEEFLKVLKEEEEGAAPRPAAPAPPAESKDTRTFDTGLPPWVKEMRKASADERAEALGVSEEEGEEQEEEEELRADEETEAERVFTAAEREDVSRTDSGIGLPEKAETKLPFGTPATSEAVEEEPLPAPRRAFEFEKAPAEARVAAPRPPFHLGNFLKAKAFDVLFLIAIWLVCLWLAADRLNGTIFDLFNVASGALFAFGGILLVLYFFLFEFFLGETLGDRLFREWDEGEAGD